MKRRILMYILLLVMVLNLSGCNQPDHDQLVSEIGEKNRAFQEKRHAFLDAQLHQTAEDYVQHTVEALFPGNTCEMTLEPGSLLDEDLSEYADFSENADTRKAFFSKADLYICVDFWNYDTDGMTAATMLMEYQISGRLAADEYKRDVYQLDAVSGKAVFVPMPGV